MNSLNKKSLRNSIIFLLTVTIFISILKLYPNDDQQVSTFRYDKIDYSSIASNKISFKCSDNEKYTSVCFVHVDVDEARDICEKYSIEGMPTFILFENSEEVTRFSGANEGKLTDMLSKCNK